LKQERLQYGLNLYHVIDYMIVEGTGLTRPQALAAINQYPYQKELFERIKAERTACIKQICEQRPANRRYKLLLSGWLPLSFYCSQQSQPFNFSGKREPLFLCFDEKIVGLYGC